MGAILVFDLTSAESFRNLPYWINAIREQANENCLITLVANKGDLVDQIAVG
jgi:GTPase SAR1 family protein